MNGNEDEWNGNGNEAGNMKPALQHLVVEWILESWNWLEKNFIITLFKSCGLNLKTDGSKDHLIHCFKEGQPCANGLDILQGNRICYWMQSISNSNPFGIMESDTEEANMNNNLINHSNSEHDLIDAEL